MKNSFKIFIVFVGLLVIVIMFRLNSVSYPWDSEDDTEVVYLEELHGYGSLFDIEYRGNRFLMRPLASNIKVNGVRRVRRVEIRDSDLITIESHRFLFSEFPGGGAYREIFRRPLREVFLHANDLKYIGGWRSIDRESILARKENRDLLKKLLVEIAADELKKIIPGETFFDGKLLELGSPAGNLRVKSPGFAIILVRDWEEEEIKSNTPIFIRDGDILKIPYQDSKSRPASALFIKFNLTRYREVDYLVIAYKDLASFYHLQKPGREIAFLKSPEGMTYPIDKTRRNAFIGSGGLFSFNLVPSDWLGKFYIPDKIPEGGVMDIKELLDRGMYYRKGNQFYPVSREFLYQLKDAFKKMKTKKEIRGYFEKNKIIWRDFNGYREFKRFCGEAASLMEKMENKGIFRFFCQEIEKLNSGHRIVGIGLDLDRSLIQKVAYKTSGRSWSEAGRIHENTPIISDIDDFYWGAAIRYSDEPVEFKITFNQPVSSLGLIAAADYGISFDGKQYTAKNFFDGVQTIEIPEGKKEFFVRVWNIKTFNHTLGSTNFQAEIVFRHPGGERMVLATDHTWEGSINGFHWTDVRVSPDYSLPDPDAGQLKPTWYDEKWNPVYRGIKTRYFRKKFELEEIPQAVTWNIFALGNYLVRVNRQVVQTGKDFLDALEKGENTITVMVTRRGYRKHFYISQLFRVEDHRIFLKQKRVQRAGFKKRTEPHKPFILDINHTPLAYDSQINEKSQRFYTPQAMTGFFSLLGSPEQGTWGLEQICAKLYREDQIQAIRLTVNHEWQTIVLAALKKVLFANREKELKSPTYKKLMKELEAAQARLQQERSKLSAGKTSGQQQIMEAIIELQNDIERLKRRISKIKNHFYEAAVILMTPKGEIRTAASYPYNNETMAELNPHLSKPYRPGENPYLNRCWEWQYNPGSTAKVIDCIAFLDSRERKDIKGRYLFPYLRALLTSKGSFKDFPRSDLKGSTMLNGKEIDFRLRNIRGHTIPEGFCSLEDALSHSYNTYFSYLALHNNRVLTHDSLVYDKTANKKYQKYFISKANIPVAQTYKEYPLLEFAEKLLLNREIDLLYNLRDTSLSSQLVRMPNDAFMAVESRFPLNAYTSANVAHYSIGQGDFRLTALQNAMVVSTVLNRGVLYHPAMIKSLSFKNKQKPLNTDPEKDKIPVYSAAIAGRIKAAMKDVVEHGTADELFRGLKKGRQFYAKTGTAETELYKDNSLFVGFVTFRDGTSLVFSVIVPRSGHGVKVAGKLTEEILKTIISHENKKGGKLHY